MNNQAQILIKQKKELERMLSQFPVVMGVEAKNHFVKSFKNQGFTDETLQRWKQRKSGNNGRAILVKSGDLRRSIKVVRTTSDSVTLGSDLPYSKIHNEGGKIEKKERKGTINFKLYRDGRSRFAKAKNANFQQDAIFKEHTINIPQRKFMGNSASLIRNLKDKLQKGIKRIFR